jgi:hypothetical protein
MIRTAVLLSLISVFGTSNLSAGIQAVSLTNGSLTEGDSSISSQSVSLSGATGSLADLNSLTLTLTRGPAGSGGILTSVFLRGSNATNSLDLLGADYSLPPSDLVSVSSSGTVSASSEITGTNGGDSNDIFSDAIDFQIFGSNDDFTGGRVAAGQFTEGVLGYFGLRFTAGSVVRYGYGSLTAIDTATAGVGVTLGSTLYFEDTSSSISVGATPPSGGGTTGGSVPEPTGLAVIGFFGCVAALQGRRRR